MLNLFGQINRPIPTFEESIHKRANISVLLAPLLKEGDFRIRILRKVIDCHDGGHAEFSDVVQMGFKIYDALLQGFKIFFLKLAVIRSAMQFQSANRGYHDHAVRVE